MENCTFNQKGEEENLVGLKIERESSSTKAVFSEANCCDLISSLIVLKNISLSNFNSAGVGCIYFSSLTSQV